jgi:glycosyltransferase involved in cell wall biosynthesis
MDLYPDVLVAHGGLKPGFRYALLAGLARWQFQGASAVIALGPRMARKVGEYVEDTPLGWAALWQVEEAGKGGRGLRKARGWGRERLVLMYSGNMGRGHALEDFLNLAGELGPRGPLWVYAGEGARKHQVLDYAAANPRARIQSIGSVPAGQVGQSLASADVLLVSLKAEWEGLMVPSKIQGIFASGRPVIFVGGTKNEIADWIMKSGAGWVLKEGDRKGLSKAVREAENAGERRRRGTAGRAFGRKNFDREVNVGKVCDLLLAPWTGPQRPLTREP